MKETETLPTIFVPRELTLPDNSQWTNRFYIKSETSGSLYTVAQNINNRHWACNCPGWIRHRKCKHLQSMNLPCFEQPYEVIMSSR